MKVTGNELIRGLRTKGVRIECQSHQCSDRVAGDGGSRGRQVMEGHEAGRRQKRQLEMGDVAQPYFPSCTAMCSPWAGSSSSPGSTDMLGTAFCV